MGDCKATQTPVDTSTKLIKAEDNNDEVNHIQLLIGVAIWMNKNPSLVMSFKLEEQQ